MNADDARAALEAALRDDRHALLNAAVRGASLDEGSPARFDLTDELSHTVAADVREHACALLDKQFLAYDPSYQTSSSQVLVEALDLIPPLASIDAAIRGGDLPRLDGDDPAVAMAHVIGVDADQVVAYRVQGAGIATTRRRAMPLVPRDDVYGPVRGGVLYYEPRFDVVTAAGYAFFVNVSVIQWRLNAPEKARRLAQKTLRRVTAGVAIAGYAELERAVMDDRNLRAKIAQVHRLVDGDPEYAARLTTDNLLRFVEANPDYGIPVAQVDGRPALLFDPAPARRHQIPKLLADDYLISELTTRRYEAGSKHQVRA